jgi:ABC-2 type transport system ATP-binding protein
MADDGVSVVLSSHLLAELERVADYLVLISHGRVRVDDDVESLLACHRLVTAPTADLLDAVDGEVIESVTTGSQTQRLVRLATAETQVPPGCEARAVGVEEMSLAYLRESPTALMAVTLTGATR